MKEQVLNTIYRYGLINECREVIVGLSGGADSVCLLSLLAQLGKEMDIAVRAVHIHHGLRGADADEDTRFCEQLCRRMAVPLKVYYRDIRAEAEKQGLSEEEAGRLARYEIFEAERAGDLKVKIAVAHHMNDQCETVLHHLIRGSSLKGLGGMRPERGYLIRPLLFQTRMQIEAYLEEKELGYREDASNQETVYTRNKIRLELIPYLKSQFNPLLIERVSAMAGLLREDEDYLEGLAQQAYLRVVRLEESHRVALDIGLLQEESEPIRRRIYRIAIMKLNLTLANYEYKHSILIESMLAGGTGRQIDLPMGMQAVRSYGNLIIQKQAFAKTGYARELDSEQGEIELPDGGGTLKWEVFSLKKSDVFPENRYTKWFDYDRIKGKLKIRTRLPGDGIVLKGVGRKKLKDFFIDLKVPRDRRDQIPLLAEGSEIIWVVGMRMHEDYKISEKTNRVLKMELYKEDL